MRSKMPKRREVCEWWEYAVCVNVLLRCDLYRPNTGNKTSARKYNAVSNTSKTAKIIKGDITQQHIDIQIVQNKLEYTVTVLTASLLMFGKF